MRLSDGMPPDLTFSLAGVKSIESRFVDAFPMDRRGIRTP